MIIQSFDTMQKSEVHSNDSKALPLCKQHQTVVVCACELFHACIGYRDDLVLRMTVPMLFLKVDINDPL